ncbi:MAG: protein kinase [Pseudomonadota bacterium]
MSIQCPYCDSEHPDDARVCPSTGKELSRALKLVGGTIDKYEILRLIGEGGMGAVYEARHSKIRRKVALKLLNQEFAQNAEVLARFEREARATGEIGHENIIEIYDIGRDEATGATYLVLELLKGKTLQDLIDEKKGLAPQEAVDIMLQVLSALHASHSLGIVHRDLKPENIFLITLAGRKNWVKILDFGIAKIKETGDAHKLTQTGTMMGTPYYMAPEQITGSRNMDHRLDVYACGIILYQCVTGKVPYNAPTVPGLVYSILNATPESPVTTRPGTPDELSDIILKSMAREPADRYQNVMEMAAALEEFGSGMMQVEEEKRRVDELSGTVKGQLEEFHGAAQSTSTELEWKNSQAGAATEGKGRKAVVMSAVVAILVLLGVGGYLFLGSGLSGNGDAPAKAPPGEAIQAAPKPVPAPVEEAPAGKAADGARENERMELAVKASPDGAAIYLDGAPVGRSPFSAGFPKSDTPHLIEVRLDGYAPFSEWVKFTAPVSRNITLEAEETGKKGKKGKKGKGGDKASSEKTEPSDSSPGKKKGKGDDIYTDSPY